MHLLRRSARLLVIVAALSLAISASASATTVTVSPGGNATGAGTTDWFLTASNGATFDCRTSTTTSTFAGGSVTISGNVQQNFSSCTLVGVGGYTVACTSTAVLTVTGLTASGVTPVSLTNISCTATVPGVCSARFGGSVPASYSNTTRQLTIIATGQSVAISGSTCGSLVPNGAATFTGPSRANFVYRVSPSQTITVT